MSFFRHGKVSAYQMLISIAVAGSLLSISLPAASAEASPPIMIRTLQDALEVALQENPGIQAAEAQYQAADEQVRQARSRYLPSIRSGAEFGEGWRNDLDRQYLTVTASQMLYDFGQTRSRIDVEQADRDVRYSDYQLEKNNLIVDVAEAYIEVIRQNELVGVVEEKLARITEVERIAEARVNLGGSDNADLIHARSRYQSALSERLAMQSSLREWRMILSSLTQSPVAEQLSDDMSALDGLQCSASENSLGNSLHVRNTLEKRKAANSVYDLSSRNNRPAVFLEIGARQLLSSSQFEPRDQDYRIELKFEMDLYDGGNNAAEVNSNLYLLDSAESSVRSARIEVKRRVDRSLSNIDFINDKIEVLESQRAAAEEARRLFIEQYQTVGNRSLSDILNNEEEINSASVQIVNAEIDKAVERLRCSSAIGDLEQLLLAVQ